MLNDSYYYNFICPYISHFDRQICSRRDRFLIADKNIKKQIILASIYLHTGYPCYRYCICRYFNNIDVINAYTEYKKIQS